MSRNCEPFEVLVSTFLDEGLDRPSQSELLDHFSRCAECRRFYQEARSLDGLVAVVEPRRELDPAPEAVWEAIERRTGRPAAGRGRWLIWSLAAAAALLVGIALPFMPWPAPAPTDDRQVEIRLEGNRGAMTESRFVELTTELLQADRKYHFAMQDVMEAIIDTNWEAEGATSEGDADESGGEDDNERRARVRT